MRSADSRPSASASARARPRFSSAPSYGAPGLLPTASLSPNDAQYARKKCAIVCRDREMSSHWHFSSVSLRNANEKVLQGRIPGGLPVCRAWEMLAQRRRPLWSPGAHLRVGKGRPRQGIAAALHRRDPGADSYARRDTSGSPVSPAPTGPRCGSHLRAHPGVDKVSFTGSKGVIVNTAAVGEPARALALQDEQRARASSARPERRATLSGIFSTPKSPNASINAPMTSWPAMRSPIVANTPIRDGLYVIAGDDERAHDPAEPEPRRLREPPPRCRRPCQHERRRRRG